MSTSSGPARSKAANESVTLSKNLARAPAGSRDDPMGE